MIYLVSPNDDRNYGAALQATGLQTFLKNLGYKSEFVTFERGNLDYILEKDYSTPKNILKSLFVGFYKKQLICSCKKFEEYVYNNHNCTEKFNSYNDMKSNLPKGAAYIVGSDQVWPETNLLPQNLLKFAPKDAVKMSYAASTGTAEIKSDNIGKFKEFLSDYKAVSIREKRLINSISKIYSGEIDYHVDPTLLHNTSFWASQEKKYPGKLPDEYILLYFIFTPKDINKKLRKLKKVCNLPLVLVSNTPVKNIYCDYHIRDAGPAEFLWLVHHSKGVIASSFHGCIFSTIFEKPLLAVNNPQKSERIINLLEILNMSYCLEWNDNFINEYKNSYNYKDIIENEIRRSKEYFLRNLNHE